MNTIQTGKLTIVCEISNDGYNKILDNPQLLNAIAAGIQSHFDVKEYTSDDKTIVKSVQSEFKSYAQLWRKD